MKIAKFVVEGENIREITDILYNHKDEEYIDDPYIYSVET